MRPEPGSPSIHPGMTVSLPVEYDLPTISFSIMKISLPAVLMRYSPPSIIIVSPGIAMTLFRVSDLGESAETGVVRETCWNVRSLTKLSSAREKNPPRGLPGIVARTISPRPGAESAGILPKTVMGPKGRAVAMNLSPGASEGIIDEDLTV